jgi:FkbM family methyltransferase
MARRQALIFASAIVGVVLGACLTAGWPWARADVLAWFGADERPDPDLATLDQLHSAYGPKLYSQNDEETLIRAFFRDRKDGFFLDVGASDYEKDSTTYYLEKHLGWRGIAIDALEQFRPDYERFRPATRFFAYFVTNHGGFPTDFHVYTRDTRISSGSLAHLRDLPRIKDRYIKTKRVPTITLDHLLAAQQIEKINFVSLDIEGSEPEALEGFDIDRYRPDLLCVETQPYTIDRLHAYFTSHGYVRIEQYRQADSVNEYYRPTS